MNRSFLLLLLLSFLAISCGDARKDEQGSLNDKKARLQKLKTDQKKLGEEIALLEAEIRKEDPTAIAGTAKLVAVNAVGAGDFQHYIEIQGKIDAQNISYVAPPNGQGGVVTALYVRQGQQVRKGQVLAKLDDQLIRQQIEPLRVQLATAEDTYRRTKNLFDQGVGTYQNVLNARTQVETLQRQIGVIQKQAALMTITAPASGVADQVNVRVGEFFTGNSPAGPQIRIVNTSDLKVVAAVPEAYLGRVGVGSRLQIELPEQNNRIIDATVNVAQKVIDPNTRSFQIEARIPSDASLKPNQLARVRILDYTSNNAITVPLNVVQTDEKGKYVYIMVTENGKNVARRRTISTGESFNDQIEVKSGLNSGDRVITEGYQELYEGQVIAIAGK
jgi:RND family efflux transporter MFP subunit